MAKLHFWCKTNRSEACDECRKVWSNAGKKASRAHKAASGRKGGAGCGDVKRKAVNENLQKAMAIRSRLIKFGKKVARVTEDHPRFRGRQPKIARAMANHYIRLAKQHGSHLTGTL